ncbi:MAG: CRISPR-associated protein Cas10 [Hydrococcus sp. SU_1_0]|nr:CRISPR-associated protein Cas10 [Hydrococcus sp. SU_1_0]
MTIYTAITFAPVQGFIEKSRKLRDLYGSSFLLSYLAKAICDRAKAQKYDVVSPALIDVTQGTPNQIIIEGNQVFDRAEAESSLNQAWGNIVETVRVEIENAVPHHPYHWQRDWNHWKNHAWEFFWGQGQTIDEARQAINENKRSRNWVGVNWVGESSTLSGGDGVAWYGMSDQIKPKEANMGEISDRISHFYDELSRKFSNAIIDTNEQLSIPELIKRLITLKNVAKKLNLTEQKLPSVEYPESFKDINRKKNDPEENRWTGWFQGDGDKIGDYLKHKVQANSTQSGSESDVLREFSWAMMNWGEKNLKPALPQSEGRIIYAGGDDFLGVLYRNEEPKLQAQDCLNWFYQFPDIWESHKVPITVSVGLVWAAPDVPQRDVLQHCRETESSAKANGRDRLAIRVLFNSGNYLDWHCPWWWLEELLTSYRDRNGSQNKPNWTHIYNDVAVLESRHAFQGNKEVALELFEIYFGKQQREKLANPEYLWNVRTDTSIKTGILGDEAQYSNQDAIDRAIANWIINLAKVGFHLCHQKHKP